MKRAVVAAVVMTFLPVAWARAGEARAADRTSELSEALAAMRALIDVVARADAGSDDLADAPARLREMLRSGRADESDVALVTRWIFQENEEVVARGLSDALRSADLAAAGPQGERWKPAAAAMTALFESALRDAAARRRPDRRDWPELNALVTAAAPAIAASLREADPATRAELQRLLAAAAAALRGAERDGLPAAPAR
jgi:hypothetical protein